MKIAELFVNLGIAGSEKAVGAMQGVQKGLGSIASTGLLAKAAALAAVYAIERLTSAAAHQGMGLNQFAEATGLSADMLQRWQYAARQFGVGAEEMEGTIKGVQDAMTSMLMGKGAPEHFGVFMQSMNVDPNRLRDTFYIMQKLQDFAKSGAAAPDVTKSLLKGFGISDNMFAFFKKNALDLAKIPKSQLFSDGEIGRLKAVDVAWSNLWAKIKMAIGHLTASKGLGIVGQLSKAADQAIRLFDALVKIADKLKLFDAFSKSLELFADALNSITAGIGEAQKNALADSLKIGPNGKIVRGEVTASSMALNLTKQLGTFLDNKLRVGPAAAFAAAHGQGKTNLVVHNYGVKDAKEASHLFGREVDTAYRQSPAQRRKN